MYPFSINLYLRMFRLNNGYTTPATTAHHFTNLRNIGLQNSTQKKILAPSSFGNYSTYENSDLSLAELLSDFLHFEVKKLMEICLEIDEMGHELQNRLNVANSQIPNLPIVSIFSRPTTTSFFYCLLTNHTLADRKDVYTGKKKYPPIC